MIKPVPFILLFLTCITLSFAQLVKKIEIEGNKYVSEDLIKEILVTKEGSKFSLEKVRRDIKQLYRTGFFKRIEVHKFDDAEGVRLLYVVEDLPVIYKIEFEGNEELDDEDLSEKLGVETEVGKTDVDELITGYTSSPAIEERIEISRRIKLGRVLSEKDIVFLINRIKDIYREEGYPDVEVSYRIVPKKGASKLVFTIRENDKKYVGSIIFVGNHTFPDSVLFDQMRTQDRNIFIFRLDPPFNEEVVKEDVESIREFYKSEGFLEVRVDYYIYRANGRHDVIVFIEEGPRYKLYRVNIEGNKLYARSEILGDTLKRNKRKGGYYREAVINTIKNRARSLYMEIGYANAHIEERKFIDTERKEVEVTLRVIEGDPVYIRKVKVEGNYETRDYVIRRELRVQEQELAIRKGLRRSRSRILNLGYYEDVQIQPFPVGEEKWDLLVKIRERFTGQFSVGLSYNEVTRLSGFVSLRKGNFLGTGDVLGLSISYGSQYRDNSLSYTDKWFLNMPVDLTWSVFDRRIEYTTYTIERRGLSGTFSREFWEYWRWSAGFSFQRIRYSDIDENASSFIKGQEGLRESRKFTLGLSRDTRDFYLFPTEGSLMTFNYTLAAPVLGGTEQFHRATLSASKFIRDDIFESGFVFSAKGTAGIVEPYGGTEVPLDERFFVGGDFTLRGYNYGMAGVVDNNNDPIGSTRELIFNFEINYKLHDMVYLGVFYDTGLGSDRVEDFKSYNNWRGGYGVGIRVITPMAPIRLDWAWKTKPVPGDTSPSRIHFILGGFF